MTTTPLTPPPTSTPPTSTPPAPGPAGPQRSAPRVIAILTTALGVAVVLGTIATSVVSTVAAGAGRFSDTRSLGVAGVTAIEVEAAAGDLSVVFGDVDEATLHVTDTAAAWTFEVDDDTLRVETPRRTFFGWGWGGNGHAVLTLPDTLEGVDASFSLGAGGLGVDGTFGELDLDLAAGELDVTGTADALDLRVGAGNADVTLRDVTEADLGLSAGDATVRLEGSAPREVSLEVSAGTFDLLLPDQEYAVRADVSAGSLDTDDLRTNSSASRTITVDVSAGEARIRPVS